MFHFVMAEFNQQLLYIYIIVLSKKKVLNTDLMIPTSRHKNYILTEKMLVEGDTKLSIMFSNAGGTIYR
jgi:hypothetical protein